MTKQELGKRTELIRKEILDQSQDELAHNIGSTQTLVSRMERGRFTVNLMLSLLLYYRKKGLNAHMILHEPFNKELMVQANASKDEAIKAIEDLRQSNNNDLERIADLLNNL